MTVLSASGEQMNIRGLTLTLTDGTIVPDAHVKAKVGGQAVVLSPLFVQPLEGVTGLFQTADPSANEATWEIKAADGAWQAMRRCCSGCGQCRIRWA